MAARSTREREAERRKAKLELVDEQIRAGSLKVRKMTAEERARWGRSPDKERPGRRRSR
ncbi:MAG: hypothetical protein ACR2ML_01250 [Solirubrobacteraceae bacterium]